MNSEYEQYKMDGLHEECGVFGMPMIWMEGM